MRKEVGPVFYPSVPLPASSRASAVAHVGIRKSEGCPICVRALSAQATLERAFTRQFLWRSLTPDVHGRVVVPLAAPSSVPPFPRFLEQRRGEEGWGPGEGPWGLMAPPLEFHFVTRPAPPAASGSTAAACSGWRPRPPRRTHVCREPLAFEPASSTAHRGE